MAKQIFDTDIINHNGRDIAVNTYMDDQLELTEEFTRKGFKFIVKRNGHVLEMHSMKTQRCRLIAASSDLVRYEVCGRTFKVRDNEKCCNTMTEQMSLINVADWMYSIL